MHQQKRSSGHAAAPHEKWHDVMTAFHQPVPGQDHQSQNQDATRNCRPSLQTWHEARTSGEAHRLDRAASDARATEDQAQRHLLSIMGPGVGVDDNEASEEQQQWPQFPRRPMPAHSPLLAALRGSEQNTSDAMSPFAGFAALSKGRASMDASDGNHSFTANQAHRHRRSSVHIEDMVRDKVLKQVPRHVRQSLDRVGSEAGRKSLESAAPPPAQSTGMRNSHEGVALRRIDRAPSIPPNRRMLSSDSASHSQMQQADRPNNHRPAQDDSRVMDDVPAPTASFSGGLNKYSPFAQISGTSDNN